MNIGILFFHVNEKFHIGKFRGSNMSFIEMIKIHAAPADSLSYSHTVF